jgi:hypothetical protein
MNIVWLLRFVTASICAVLGTVVATQPAPATGRGFETDALPFGEVRERWAPIVLAKLQPEIDKAEHCARNVGYSPCQNLVARFTASENDAKGGELVLEVAGLGVLPFDEHDLVQPGSVSAERPAQA